VAKASDNQFPKITMLESSAPATPAATLGFLYEKTDGKLYFKNDAGTETELTIGTLQAASFKRTAGDYTTTSTTFVDVDATNFALTFTTGARRVMIGLVGSCANSATNSSVVFDVTVDGTRQGGTSWGLQRTQIYTATAVVDCSFVYITAALTAASHTFKLQWRASADTATLYGSDPVCEFFAVELLAG
jgi:hypothetical protein